LEHVTNYIYENESLFRIKWIKVDKRVYARYDIRLTIDTITDFTLAQGIYNKLNKCKEKDFNTLISIIEKDEKLVSTMKSQIIKNEK